MAFCPECGKAVTPDNVVCSSCGKQLRSDDKKGRNGRFHGTMMMTAPDVKQAPPANENAQAAAEHADLAAAAGMTSPRLSMPATAKRTSQPASAKQNSQPAPRTAGSSFARPNPALNKATIVGTGGTPSVAAKASSKAPQKRATMVGTGVDPTATAQPSSKAGGNEHATMLGAALAPTTPRSKPPGAASNRPDVQARASIPAPAEAAQAVPQSDRPLVARPTTPQASNTPSVRAVQSVPVSPSPAQLEAAHRSSKRPAPLQAPTPAVPTHPDAQTVASPVLRLNERDAPDPARMVQAIPEVTGSVVEQSPGERNEARTVPREYLPGDPMGPKLAAAKRTPREHPFAPEQPEIAGQGSYIMLYWAVCVAVAAAVSALAFRLF